MTGPLDRIDGRLGWAGKHIDQVEREVKTFLAGGPLYEVSPEAQPDGRSYVFRAHQLRSIDMDLGYLVGDCIHNLRAILDNIAYGLVSSHKKPNWNTAFPICRNPSQFQAKALPKLIGIPQAAIDIIESLQPYHSPDRASQWTVRLDSRWNRDKHRSPTLVGAIPAQSSFLESDGDALDYAIYTNKGIQDGMKVGHVTYRTPDHTARQPHFDFEIAIEEAGLGHVRNVVSILKTNQYLIRNEVLDRLRPYF